MPALTLTPIGVVHSPFSDKRSAPRQPQAGATASGTIELHVARTHPDTLIDLERWSHIWVLFWFDRSTGWKSRVMPPRSARKRGVFATRAPHRPNPIGMSVVRLTRVEGHLLHVAELDMIDGTPVLDIKPYVPYADARLDASSGWLDDALAPADPGPRYAVAFSERAEQQLSWLAPRLSFDLRALTIAALELGPAPHAYRRIRADGDALRIGIKDFRLRFRVATADHAIEVVELATGYRQSVLEDADAAARAETPLDVHRAFVARFGARAAK
jgi:tRNA-Thr(GGU) m(6)t(6)A37 methyltransferase TsaA